LVAEAEVVCLAAGPACTALAPIPRLQPVRGQASWTDAVEFEGVAAAWGGYAIPLPGGGVLFGATHDRNDREIDLRPADHAHNLQLLEKGRPALAGDVRASHAPLSGRAALRAATPDHLPLAGAAPDRSPGLYLLTGLGGRGFTLAPLLAEHVAALALGAPSPLPRRVAEAVDPRRLSEPR
jgi:tRNA 5-methylaminomethyl-2-thiouridine biosynthesis bifunctional protein